MSHPSESAPDTVDFQIHWQFRPPRGGLPQDVSTPIYAMGGRPDLLLVPGYAETERSAKAALTTCHEVGRSALAAVISPDSIPSINTIEEMVAFGYQALPAILEQWGQGSGVTEPIDAIGHSMGGGFVGLLLREGPEFVANVGFAEPVGHDTSERQRASPGDFERRAQFMFDFAHALLRQPYSNFLARVPGSFAVVDQIIKDLRSTHFDEKFAIPTEIDCVPDVLAHAAAGNQIAYVLGNRDPLVTPPGVWNSLVNRAGTDPVYRQALLENITVLKSMQAGHELWWGGGLGKQHIKWLIQYMAQPAGTANGMIEALPVDV